MTQTLRIRDASFNDVPTILQLIIDGAPGDTVRTEDAPEDRYRAAFEAITDDPQQLLLVAEFETGSVIATMQLTFIPGLTNGGAWRMLMESVHVSPSMRGKGVGAQMLDYAIAEARHRGCEMVQLTSNKLRKDAHRFYERIGFARSHEGFKLYL